MNLMNLHVYIATSNEKMDLVSNLFCVIYNSNVKYYFAHFCIFKGLEHIIVFMIFSTIYLVNLVKISIIVFKVLFFVTILCFSFVFK